MATFREYPDFAAVKWWARQAARLQRNSFTGSTTFVQVLGRDPLRWAFILPAQTGTTTSIGFGEQPPATGGYSWNTLQQPFALTEDEWGDVIQGPVWIKFVAGGGTFDFWTFSYDPQRKVILDEYIARCISVISTL